MTSKEFGTKLNKLIKDYNKKDVPFILGYCVEDDEETQFFVRSNIGPEDIVRAYIKMGKTLLGDVKVIKVANGA